jgi:hypothetical protein
MVSGLATQATCWSAVRPSRLPISSKGGALGIRKAYSGWKVRPEDAIFCDQILILEQEFLIDQADDVRQEPSQFVVWHEEDPS